MGYFKRACKFLYDCSDRLTMQPAALNNREGIDKSVVMVGDIFTHGSGDKFVCKDVTLLKIAKGELENRVILVPLEQYRKNYF